MLDLFFHRTKPWSSTWFCLSKLFTNQLVPNKPAELWWTTSQKSQPTLTRHSNKQAASHLLPIRPRSAETYLTGGLRAPQFLHLAFPFISSSFRPANVVDASLPHLTPPAAAGVGALWLSAESLSGPCSQRKFLKITPFPVTGCIQAMMGGSKSPVVEKFWRVIPAPDLLLWWAEAFVHHCSPDPLSA